MKIQDGQVRYKDRDDYKVKYGITDDGKQYYFITKDVESLSNGNRIATTELVEAIDDMVKPEHIGVVSEAGVEVIPCTHRRIKPIVEGVLLAEVANPVSQNVIDANVQRNDPQAATNLVSTTTTVKDKISKEMGSAGRFIFNDLFSEATIYDIDGNNLVNGEYYSFVGLDVNNKLYLSKNTVDSEVATYGGEVKEEMSTEEVVAEQPVAEQPVAEETPVVDETIAEVQAAAPITPDVPVAETPVEQTPTEEVAVEEVNEENDLELPTISEDEVEQAPQEEITEEVSSEAVEDETEEEVVEEPVQEESLEDIISMPVTKEVSLEGGALEMPEEDLFEDEVELDLPEDNEEEDALEDSEIKVDSIEPEVDYSDFVEVEKDPDIAEGTKIISGLIKQNKELKNTVANLEDELDRQKLTTKSIAEKAKMQEQKIEVLTEGRKKDRNKIVSLENAKKELEEKVSYLERINSSQADEIDMLKPQLEGKEELVKLYAEAESLLDNDNDFDIDDYSFSRKVA